MPLVWAGFRWRCFREPALLAATISVGLMAGVFGLYAHTIMPGLGKTDDRTFVRAFQAIDRAIINVWFLPVFIGALILTPVAAVLSIGEQRRDVLPWAVGGIRPLLAGVRRHRPGERPT